MRVARTVLLFESQRSQLRGIANSKTASVRFAQRAKMILLAGEGLQDKQIAAIVAVRRQAVALWRGRWLDLGIDGIAKDAPRGGRHRTARSAAKVRAIIQRTTQATPPDATHWSTNSMARAEGVSASTVGRVWREHGIKPHRTRSFKLSNDKRFVEKLDDIVGLYLNPPEQALVLSCDEKSHIQALDRTQPGLPLRKGKTATMTHDYVRHGTTTLFAALSTLDGKVIGTCMPRHRHQEWIKFLTLIDQQTPADKPLHLIVDNYATHKHPKVIRWLQRHPRFHIHFTPTSASWLNMVERFFRDLTGKRLKRGVFGSVKQLITAIEQYIQTMNRAPKPFIWTAKATDILEKVKLARESLHKPVTD
ncbi:MAG: IS630 family transposase [Burkholderiales bacterium]|nr:IS630 family transposase [Phycisphaerae bacterium]